MFINWKILIAWGKYGFPVIKAKRAMAGSHWTRVADNWPGLCPAKAWSNVSICFATANRHYLAIADNRRNKNNPKQAPVIIGSAFVFSSVI